MPLKILNYKYVSGIIRIASVFLMSCMTSCVDDMILEMKYIPSLTVEEVKKSPLLTLQLKGLAMHSAMGVSKTETVREGDSLVVLVHMTLVRGRLSGNLNAEVTVPPDVNRVLFGKNRVEVWNRNGKP